MIFRVLLFLFAGLAVPSGTALAACSELLDAQFRPLAGKEKVRLCDLYQGKVLLIVNTASKCGYTPQYEGLEALHEKYEKQGFAVLGFPSNDFMGQEPGSEAEIREFCTLTYGVKFPMFEKVRVKKGQANAFYDRLAAASKGEYPGWNFHKYLVDRDGKVQASFVTKVPPDDPMLIDTIEKFLKAKPAAAKGEDPAPKSGG